MITSNIAGLGGVQMPLGIPSAKPEIMPQNLFSQGSDNQVAKVEAIKNIEKNITVEEYIRNYFSDIPIMIEIAKCESRFRQYDKSGEVIRGKQNNLDAGVMQINEYYHGEDSKKLGYDIMTIEGNTSYARYIFEKYGVQPWVSSRPCWGKSVAYSEYKELALN